MSDIAALVLRLRTQLAYDMKTGIFTRRVQTSNRVNVGDIAGWLDETSGYVYFGFDGKRQAAHRMAWLYVFGELPVGEVDHRDTIRHHNWIDNLRDESTVVNQHNQVRAHRQSKTGLLGVSPDSRRGGFNAQIVAHGRSFWLGHFQDAAEAHAAYVQAKRSLHQGCTL